MPRIVLSIRESERKALVQLGELERRDPRQQAAVLIRQALEEMGLLQPIQLNEMEAATNETRR